MRGLAFVRDEAVQAGAQVRAEASLRDIVSGEEVVLESAREEALSQVLRVLVRVAVAQAQVLVDRPPVGGEKQRQPALALDGVRALRGEHRRCARGRELARALADVGVVAHDAGISYET